MTVYTWLTKHPIHHL